MTGSTTEQTYEYAAFVSYRHTEPDKSWAKWLVETLETYKVPKALRERGYPTKIGKLYRDEDEAHAGAVLGNHIATALDQSRALIIVCTSNTQASPWVEREIEYFRSLGRDDRIFCLLAEGEPETSFPKSLLQRVSDRSDALAGPSANQGVAADVRPTKDAKPNIRKRDAALRLISGILGCKFDDLKRRDEERERKRRQRNWITAGVAFLAVAISGLWYWDQSRVKTRYYSNITTEFGVPVGVGEINSVVFSQRALAYQLQSTWGQVRKVVRKGHTAYDVPLAPPFNMNDGYSWDFVYREDGGLDEITAFDSAGIVVRRDQYSIDEHARTAIVQYTRADGSGVSPIPEDDLLIDPETPQRSTGITHNTFVFDENGYVTSVLFKNLFANAVPDSTGGFGIAYQYNEDGLIISRSRLNADGQPISALNAPSISRYGYDQFLLVERRIEDAEGNLIEGGKRYARVLIDRDDHGNITDFHYYNRRNEPALAWGRYAHYATGFDEQGLRKFRAYFGYDEIPVKHIGLYDFHRVQYIYENRHLVEERFFNTEDKIAPVTKGYAIHRRMNDSFGRVLRHSYHDTQGNLTLDDDNQAIWEITRDDQGREIAWYFRDIKNDLTDKSEQYPYAYKLIEYPTEQTQQDYRFDPTGQRTLGGDGFHSRWDRRDNFGRIVESRFFGTDLNPCLCRNGYFRQVRTYDKFGNWTKSEFYDVDSTSPVAHARGYEIWEAKYNSVGLRTLIQTTNRAGDYIPSNSSGAAYTTFGYDDFGRLIETRYFLDPSNPVDHKRRGYHRELRIYANDASTIPSETRYFDKFGTRLTD